MNEFTIEAARAKRQYRSDLWPYQELFCFLSWPDLPGDQLADATSVRGSGHQRGFRCPLRSRPLIRRFAIILVAILLRPCTVFADYTTNFSATENPISEGGIWANGATTGLDWKNVRTSGGVAFGTQTGTDTYRDSTALLLGTWSPDQSVTGVVHTVDQTAAIYQEVEFRLRSTLAPHVNSGYEVNFRCTHDGSQYVEIVRWNGPAGDFDYVAKTMGPGISDGDTLKAEIIGTTIRVYINGALVLTGSDSTFATGNPGIGFYLQGGPSETNSDCGFYSITATGGNPPGPGDQTAPSVPVSSQYATNFSATENPISEGGIWANGATTGLDWKRPNQWRCCICTQTGTDTYRDSTALLLGTWSPDQSVAGVVHTVNQTQAIYQQVEFRLRSTLAPHVNSGYEVNFRCTR